MRIVFAVLAVLLAGAPALAEDEDWTYGTVTAEPKGSVWQPGIPTAKGFAIGTLNVGYIFGAQQQLFGNLQLARGDSTIGVTGLFTPVTSTAFGASQWVISFSTRNVVLQTGSTSSWAVSVPIEQTGLIATLSNEGPAVSFGTQMEQWQMVGTVLWRSGVPQATVSLVYSTSWFAEK